MFFERRPIKITNVDVGGYADLAHNLCMYGVTHTLCTAFRLRDGSLLVNDATSENGAGEWAVLVPAEDGTYRQVDSVTFGWMVYQEALAAIRRIDDDDLDDGFIEGGIVLRDHPEGTCPLCA